LNCSWTKVEDFEQLKRNIENLKSKDCDPNLTSLCAEHKKIVGALVTSSCDEELLKHAAIENNVLLFTPDGSGYVERTSLSL
jgi:hypothetical protein